MHCLQLGGQRNDKQVTSKEQAESTRLAELFLLIICFASEGKK
jgi:hypothetical protein